MGVGERMDAVASQPTRGMNDASSRIARTGAQVGQGAGVSILIGFAYRQATGTDLPPEVSASLVAVVASLVAWWMNRTRLEPEPPQPVEVVNVVADPIPVQETAVVAPPAKPVKKAASRGRRG